MKGIKAFREDEKAVSPVIGVILMVAITVILAAVIGTFVLNLGSSVQTNVQAGASVQCDGSNDEIKITYTSNQNADNLVVSASGATGSFAGNPTTLNNVGDSTTWFLSGSSGNVDITVTANKGEQSTVISTKTCEL